MVGGVAEHAAPDYLHTRRQQGLCSCDGWRLLFTVFVSVSEHPMPLVVCEHTPAARVALAASICQSDLRDAAARQKADHRQRPSCEGNAVASGAQPN
jgi:hypothetical protein